MAGPARVVVQHLEAKGWRQLVAVEQLEDGATDVGILVRGLVACQIAGCAQGRRDEQSAHASEVIRRDGAVVHADEPSIYRCPIMRAGDDIDGVGEGPAVPYPCGE